MEQNWLIVTDTGDTLTDTDVNELIIEFLGTEIE